MTEIKCDYDGVMPRGFATRLRMLVDFHRLRVVFIRTDKTRHGYHVILAVSNRISPTRIVLFQSLLGSDWKREMFNSRRATAWRNVPAFWRTRSNVLYERHFRGVEL